MCFFFFSIVLYVYKRDDTFIFSLFPKRFVRCSRYILQKKKYIYHTMIPKWPRQFWTVSSVVSVDPKYNKWQMFFSTLLMISSVYTFYTTPRVVCVLELSCDNSLSAIIKGLFTRVVAFTCFMSRLMVILKGKSPLVRYETNLEKIHAFSPMTRPETESLNRLSWLLVLSCLLLTLPVNIFKLCIMYIDSRTIVVDFVVVYIQNVCMFSIETHFTALCFVLYQKFVAINRDLMALKIDTIARNKYPSAVPRTAGNNRGDDYNPDILRSLRAGRPTTYFVERSKIKYRLVREAVGDLNDMFGFHLGLSLCSLCLYAMFDLYYHLKGLWRIHYNVLIYGWLFQYTVRFVSVTILSHMLTKQVTDLMGVSFFFFFLGGKF